MRARRREAPAPVIVAMAGLPATGKSTIARRLAAELPGILLDKDEIRAALFPPSEVDYSTAQDDLCIDIMLQVAGYILRKDPRKTILLDGRPFSRRYQVEALRCTVAEMRVPLKLIECVCTDDVARERLARDAAHGVHPAGNRDFALYQAVKAQAQPIAGPKLVLDTGVVSLEMCIRRCLEYLASAA